MLEQKIKFIMITAAMLVLQSCYTLLYPPETLPETVTTTTAEPVTVATLGGAGFYGWDPYWEPTLPFTSYYRGYGASYYDPYNYYDYRDPYYAPIYIVGETPEPQGHGRNYERDEELGGARQRQPNPGSTTASVGGLGGGSVGTATGMATAAPVITAPIVTDPPSPPPVEKNPAPQSLRGKREVLVVERVKSPRKQDNSRHTTTDAPQKRVRKRK